MRKILTLIGVFLLVSLTSFSQLTISQSLTPTTGLKVGDTITVKYTLTKGQTIVNPRYLWFRYQFNNKALNYLSTEFNQGASTQTFYTGWNNYKFTPSTTNSASDNDLSVQYGLTPWNYAVNADWNVGQLTVQRADRSIDGLIATQKYILKDQNTYNNIFKIDLATGTDTTGAAIGGINGAGFSSVSNVIGNTSQFKVRVLFPTGYDITGHTIALFPIQPNGTINWEVTPIATKVLDATGEATFTTGVKVGDSLAVWMYGASGKSFMNNIITVSDAYKAFLGVSQTDISGTTNFFTRPTLEKNIGLITKNKGLFSESDSYYMLASVMGQDVSASAYIPSSTVSSSFKWFSGLLNQSWLDGTPTYKTKVTAPNQAIDMVYAWGGDLNWSHSSHPDTIASRISTNNYSNSINDNKYQSFSVKSMSYTQPTFEKATLGITSTLENGKVVLTTNLTKEGLAGLQVIMNYDESKLTLDNVIFDAGSTITNFSTKDNGRLTFGSIDQLKTARIKIGTPYKLIFTPKETLTNTAGLFFFVLADAVDGLGKKIELTVE
jgi:hypothetical protein